VTKFAVENGGQALSMTAEGQAAADATEGLPLVGNPDVTNIIFHLIQWVTEWASIFQNLNPM
jgi:hypothetical protein